MLRHGCAALGAIRQLLGLFGVVRPTLAGSRVGRTPFRYCHGRLTGSSTAHPRWGGSIRWKRVILGLVRRAVNWPKTRPQRHLPPLENALSRSERRLLMTHEHYMRLALAEAQAALEDDEVPVGAVIV